MTRRPTTQTCIVGESGESLLAHFVNDLFVGNRNSILYVAWQEIGLQLACPAWADNVTLRYWLAVLPECSANNLVDQITYHDQWCIYLRLHRKLEKQENYQLCFCSGTVPRSQHTVEKNLPPPFIPLSFLTSNPIIALSPMWHDNDFT